MSEEIFDLDGAMPFDNDALGGIPAVRSMTLGEEFAYIGKGLTLKDFADYVSSYDFGSIPPDFICLHHTAVPSASWARYPSGAVWDAGEEGLTDEQVYRKRNRQLDLLRNYYRDTLHWDRGPHLFVDERYIWLFTPMADIGIHAAQGNSYRQNGSRGRLHYSIGIEVIGYHEHVTWHPAAERLVCGAIALLKKRLNTFVFEDGPWSGKVGAHRMYNKPSCPGAAIQPSYYLSRIRKAYDDLMAPPEPATVKKYRAKSAGVNVRNGMTLRSAIVQHLAAGQPWWGEERHGDFVRLAEWGEGDIWICDPRSGKCVWKNLLIES